MQKKSISNSLTVKCLPVSLDPEFPVHCTDGIYELPSLPVTYLHYHSSLELGGPASAAVGYSISATRPFPFPKVTYQFFFPM